MGAVKLSPQQSEIQALLRKTWPEWLTGSQIAERIGTSVKSVHVQIHHMRLKGVQIQSESRVGPCGRGYRGMP